MAIVVAVDSFEESCAVTMSCEAEGSSHEETVEVTNLLTGMAWLWTPCVWDVTD